MYKKFQEKLLNIAFKDTIMFLYIIGHFKW